MLSWTNLALLQNFADLEIFMSKMKLIFFNFLTKIQLDYKIVILQLHVNMNNKSDISSDSCNEMWFW